MVDKRLSTGEYYEEGITCYYMASKGPVLSGGCYVRGYQQDNTS